MTELVYVTNKTDKELNVSFEFKQLQFPVGKTVQISVQAARQVLGYGQQDKEKYLAALGFIRLHSELEQGLERLSKFEISDSPPQQNRSLPSAVGVVPLRLEKGAGGKSTQRAA